MCKKYQFWSINFVAAVFTGLLVAGKATAQENQTPTDLKQVITPSPNASSLGQYGNVPVGLYTGSAQVNVPLYEIKEGTLSLPISLSYNSSGNKLADMASSVGLGFSLNAAGCISRSVYCLPDENRRTNPAYPMPTNLTAGQTKEELMNAIDYQPDVFFFNFNGKSGKFMLSNTSTITVSPHQNLKIQAYDGGGAPMNPPFYNIPTLMFRITDENGIVYEFKDIETNRTVNFNPDLVQNPLLNAIGVPPASSTAWYLTDMYSPTGDTIRFVYTNYTLYYDLPSSEQNFVLETGQAINGYTQPSQRTFVKNATRCQNQNKRLQQILFSNGSVVFSTSQARKDVIGDSALRQMIVFNKNGTPLKGYRFNYQYSYAGNPTLLNDTTAPTASMDNYYASYLYNLSNSSNYRLMLTSINELDNAYQTDGKNYSFSYDLTHNSLPSRFSTQRDYWGYSNGNSYNQSTFLTYQLTGPNNDPNNYLITGKEPDSNFCRQNSLAQITYPTGGYTQFNYQLHTAYMGRGILPPQVINQTANMNIDFPSYPDGYVDTTIGGVNCTYITFTFTSPAGAYANINISNIFYEPVNNPPLRFDIYGPGNTLFLSMHALEGNSGTATTYVQVNSTTRVYSYALNNYFFPTGTYKVIFYPISSYIGNTTYLNTYLGQPSFTISGWSNVVLNTDTTDIIRNIGGLRIRSTLDYDPISNKYLEKDYNYSLDSSTLPSGTLVSGASFIYPLTEFQSTSFTNDAGTTTEQAYYKYIVLNSESNYALSTTQGAYVGYSTVTETAVDPATGIPNGKTEYHYTSPKSFPDYYGTSPGPANNFPYPVADSRDWERGLLLQRTDYEYTGGQYVPLRIENDTYGTPVFVDTAAGYTARYVVQVVPGIADTSTVISVDGSPAFPNPEGFAGQYYYLTGGYVPLLSKSVTMQQSGTTITENSTYTYADAPSNLLPTSIAVVDSKGNTNTTILKYPFDYSLTTPTTSQGQGIVNLQQHHMLTPVVEKTVTKKSTTGTDMGAISGLYTTFKPTQTLPDSIFNLESATPILAYQPVTVANSSTTMDTHFSPRLSFGSYDAFGNIITQQKVGDMPMSYIWDYYNKFPIAEVRNASPADIAYTSFESNGTGNWTIGATAAVGGGITGSNYHTLASDISKAGLNSSTSYVVSYWTSGAAAYTVAGTVAGYPIKGKTENIGGVSWTYYEHLITGQTTAQITGSGGIDELRLYPSTAQMTTYTYSPLTGLTSQCDMDSRVTYYEYDSLGRLLDLKDQDGNIIKTYQYHYAGQ